MNQFYFEKSFGEWCEENGREIYLEYWCEDLNGCTPYDVSYKSGQKFAFWCGNPEHEIFYRQPHNLASKKTDRICPGCESFGQYVVDEFGREYLDAIWSDKNMISPFSISKADKTHKIWLRCLENKNHPDYETHGGTFRQGHGCPYCTNLKVCSENSLANAMPEIFDVWSDKNEKTPYDYPYGSEKRIWLKCENGIHEDFQRSVRNISSYGCGCPKCAHSEGGKKRYIDVTGQTFGRLTVLGIDPEDSSKCICQCNCKDQTILSVPKIRLRTGKTTSCGCQRREMHSAENCRWWKGGITEHNQEGRYTLEYKEWRKTVFERDNYTCQCCGKRGNGNLEAHHIYNYSANADLRLDSLNGITLCHDCHSQNEPFGFHKIYGVTNNTPEQLEEYINNRRKDLGIAEPFSLEDYINQSKEKEEMNHKRTCKVCGKTYSYCPTCSSFKNLPKWMALFDKEVCKEVFDIVSAYNTGSLSADEAKAQLMELDLSGIEIKDSIQAKIDTIMASGEVDESTTEISDDETHTEIEPKADCDGEIVNELSDITTEPIEEAEPEEPCEDPSEYNLDAAIDEIKSEQPERKHNIHKKSVFSKPEESVAETEAE